MIVYCQICSKEFKTKPVCVRKGYGKYCGRVCQYKGNPQMVGGFWTGKKRTNLMNTGAKKTMFKKGSVPWNKGIKSGVKPWLGKKRPDMVGPKNYNWKGGITPEYQRIRGSQEYTLWRTAVFMRDNYTCVWCGDDRGGNLEADHIKPFSLYPNLRFAIDNGRTLCHSCHQKTDTYGFRIYAKKN